MKRTELVAFVVAAVAAAARRGKPTSEPGVAMLRPASRHSACSASSMYRKNQLKCTIPAMSVS